ncbi:Na+-dependent transporter [Paraburkholderia dipogonis]|uniref:Na+-dependent transporter n=1 Tax=Paraburkholderia dipogonis TaxID=1211383 RepID=A0A4Y8N3V3_9BURK|nr:Na+-dependent transporter [Paraburkholderia dipogonis]TFE44497.1 Na+-dependent transporter [Paraburkholderia dipogonis]
MDAKVLILLALKIAIAGTVFTYGLQANRDDLLYIVHRPGLLLRSLIGMLVVMPLLVVASVYFLNLPQATAVVLTALAISPIPPLLPKKHKKAGGIAPYGLGLLVVLALVSIITVPVSVVFFDWLFAIPRGVGPDTLLKIVLSMIIAPLAAGLVVARLMPEIASRLGTPVRRIATLLLIAGGLALLLGTWQAIWSTSSVTTVTAIVAFIVAGLLIGHWLGGPAHEHASVLALSTASRHPAIALAISAANYPGEQFAPTLALYLILCTVLVIPYVKWQQGRSQLSSSIP